MRETTVNRWVELHRDERGLNTAELLGNAALAIIALLAIWAALVATHAIRSAPSARACPSRSSEKLRLRSSAPCRLS